MEQQLPDIATAPVESTQQTQQQEPIKDVQTFWERLDEVLLLAKQGSLGVNRVEEVLENFSDTQQINQTALKSFLFQPERISITSNDDITPNNAVNQSFGYQGLSPTEYFNQFRIRLRKALVNIKSIQLLSAVIPNAIQNIPDNSRYFFYYRIPSIANSSLGNWDNLTTYIIRNVVFNVADSKYYIATANNVNQQPNLNPQSWLCISQIANLSLGNWNAAITYNERNIVYNLQDTNFYQSLQDNNLNQQPDTSPTYWRLIGPINVDGTRPNYYTINSTTLKYVRLNASIVAPEYQGFANALLMNRTFQDYQDLVNTLNACANNGGNASIAGDVSFGYDATLNKIYFQPNPTTLAAGYFFIVAGYEDPNVLSYINTFNTLGPYSPLEPGYTLNLRCGFTWNGLFSSTSLIENGEVNNLYNATSTFPFQMYYFMRGVDPFFIAQSPITPWTNNVVVFNSYPDLVNTSCVRIYCDFALGSTQDSDGNGGLLSIVPVNATNLGIAFYQNNFNNPLTKIPKNLTEIGIQLLNDQGLPYILPNSATVSLELAIEYY